MIYQDNNNIKKLNIENCLKIKIGIQFFSESKDNDVNSFLENDNSKTKSDNDVFLNDNFRDIPSDSFQK